ncbi:helix-turn-helix domain-containing protein [Sphaerisporangium album]|uniref:helix-turn-helix domain-containing protein n=1 Tax=Sphaerisporangium album TaxID=509200 RepID=UPI0011C02D91|nr:Scr1 family TA system antitoxin-like transcriptional regulator [Sphaerisporangium album]
MQIGDAARATGLSRYTISLIKSGKNPNPQMMTLRPLAAFFGVELGWLAGGPPEQLASGEHLRAQIFGDLVGLSDYVLRTIADLTRIARRAEHLGTSTHDVAVSRRTSLSPQFAPGPTYPGAPSQAIVGRRLSLLREAQALSLDDAGEQSGIGRSAVEAVEAGEGTAEVVEALLTAYGVSVPCQRDSVMRLARGEHEPQWWDAPEIPLWFSTTARLEAGAQMIYTYQAHFVPALLQTYQYALAACRACRYDDPSQARLQFGARAAMQRQRLLEGEDAPRLWAILDESVLHRQLVAGDERIDQLDALIAATKGRVTLQIAPYDCQFVPREASFTLYRYADAPDVLCVHRFDRDEIISDQSEADAYHQTFVALGVSAIPPEETRDFLIEFRSGLSLDQPKEFD